MTEIRQFVNRFHEIYTNSSFAEEEAQFLPPAVILEEIFSTLLNVSCMRDEGRFSTFRLCFINPSSEFLDAYVYAHSLEFNKPVPFNVDSMNKLAPAINPSMSYLNLDISQRPFMLTGITASYTSWEKMILGESSDGNRMPVIPNFHVKGPGEIDACFGEMPIISYNFGKTTVPRLDVLRKSYVADELRRDTKVPLMEQFHFLTRVLWHIDKYQHGGTLLIIPEDYDYSRFLDVKYKLPARFLFNEEKSMIDISETARAKELLSYSDFISKLSTVDGAVVLNKNLDLIGFGAEILTDKMERKEPEMCFLKNDNSVDTTKKFNDNGTRHRSGYRLCSAIEHSVSLICSQDGSVKACTMHDGKVYVYSNIALSII